MSDDWITSNEYARQHGVSKATARRRLKEAWQQGLMERRIVKPDRSSQTRMFDGQVIHYKYRKK